MKRLSLSRITAAFCFVSLVLASAKVLGADSPTSISGQTFDTVITSATGSYPSSGSYRWILGDDGKYVAYGMSGNLVDISGTYLYQRVSASAGQMSFTDAIRSGFVQTYTYGTTNSGSYTVGNLSFPGGQRGNFRSFNGTAPQNGGKKVFVIQNATGNLPFAGRSSFRIITRSNDYTLQDVAGTQNLFTGNFTYTRQAKSSGILQFTDSTHTNKIAIFTFETSTRGSVFLRHTNRTSLAGTFTMSSLKPPTFVTHPVGPRVGFGQSVTLTAQVTGTAPIDYQWYFQRTNVIPGATNLSHTIPSVESTNTGEYTLVAINEAGQATSQPAVVRGFCAYSVATNRIFVDYNGGAVDLGVTTGGSCPWTVTNTPPWISLPSGNGPFFGTNLTFTVASNTSTNGRIGQIQVAGHVVSVIQGTPFAPQEIAGKTFVFESETTNLVVFSTGVATAAIVAPNGETNTVEVDYNFTRVDDDSASIVLGGVEGTQIQLLYETATGGIFELNAQGNTISGTFRSISSAPDLSGDFRGDLVWQAGNRSLAAWFMNGLQFSSPGALANAGSPPVGMRAFGAADFDRDGNTDIIFQDKLSALKVWRMDGTQKVATISLEPSKRPVGWRAFSTADVNNDGRNDVTFQHTDGRLRSWLFDGTNFLGTVLLRNGQSAGTTWKAVAVADFNEDGQADLAVQHTSGKVAVWYLNSGASASTELVRGGLTPVGWRLIGAGDINEDGHVDLILQTSTRQVAVWLKKDGSFAGAPVYLRDKKPVTTGWGLVAPK